MILTYAQLTTWPGHLRTADERKVSPFDRSTTWSATRSLLGDEVDTLVNGNRYHADAVLQIACQPSAIRRDGQLVDRGMTLDHPGVVLSFNDSDGQPLRFSCDTFGTHYGVMQPWQANVRAIALGLKDLRRITRYGLNSGDEQYRGFAALGSGIPMGAVAQSVMDLDTAARFIASALGDVGHERTPQQVIDSWSDSLVRKLYERESRRRCHPDTGGTDELFKKLLEAEKTLNLDAGLVDGST